MKRRSFLRLGAAAVATPSLAAGAPGLLAASRPRVRGTPDGGVPVQQGPLRFHANENPLGLGPRAREAVMDAVARAHTYPLDEPSAAFARAVAAHHGVDPASILPGNGSSEILQVAAQALAGPDGVVVQAAPTFGTLGQAAAAAGIEVRTAPLTPGGAHDLEALERLAEDALARGRTPLVYVCNPNNPTGTLTPVDAVEAWIRRAGGRIRFFVDEAYFEYVRDPGYRSLDHLATDLEQVLVARTFSKVHGMAGLRVGYGIAHPATVEALRPWLSDVNVNGLGLAAALAALDDGEHVERSLQANRTAMEVVSSTLDELGIEHFPSHANFVMHRVTGDLETYQARMAERGLKVGRAFPPMLDRNRLSLGTPDQMRRWAETVRDFRARGWI